MNTLRFTSLTKYLILFLAFTVSSVNAKDEAVDGNTRRILIVYFSQPEDVKLDGVDGISGASVLQKNSVVLGSTQYVAQIIQKETGGDLFRIETVKPYPNQHDPLLKYAEQEVKYGVRPELKEKIENLAEYEQIFIGYPIWWYKMPMAMYSFFEQHDFSGKKLIPFTTHGGSRFSDSLREIKRLQPNAQLVIQGLAISRNDVTDEDTPTEIINWLRKLPNRL
ncbi:flavodoxin [Serratia fonticola]|uniref:Flavodoxin n=1 Tax=Serratia fonticola TaxID=47917 RepID=A0AAE7JT84_SERFO|nr:flavodoxin [Serratia fonticola]MCO7510359.1 flavodoxin [Serratia fonticola]QKJ58529.1 flavodoxin [Serratia fonticola]